MPSYGDTLEVEDRWHLVNYIYALGDSDEPNYDSLLQVPFVEDELDLSRGEELFAAAPMARFPLVGQITEPGRNFFPSANSIEVKAVYNRSEIAFQLRWNDMRAETAGTNSPALEVPTWEEDNPEAAASGDDGGDDSFFGDFEEAASDEDFFGDLESDEAEDDFWGDAESGGEDDFWGEAGGDDGTAVGGEFTDAIAVQLPAQRPTGNRKPYFLFGDTQAPVDLWFLDLGYGRTETFRARGSALIEPSETDPVEVVSGYDKGQWTVMFKRSRLSRSAISFDQGQYTPIAFSVWDGFNRERGNKRALTSWVYLYNQPAEVRSAVGPMVQAAVFVLVIELIAIYLIRRRNRQSPLLGSQPQSDRAIGGEPATT
jgi:hypothetical protein